MAQIQTPHSLSTVFLDQPPSCLEFCPAAPDYLVIGTYLLSQSTSEDSSSPQQVKTGSIQLFKLDPGACHLTQIQTLPLPHAVFDLHFSPRDPTLFAIATSAASVSFYRLESPQSTPLITHQSTITVHDDPTIPALHLSWLPTLLTTQNQTDAFAICFSTGEVSIFTTPIPTPNPSNPSPSPTSKNKPSFTQDTLTPLTLPSQQQIEVWYTAFHAAPYPSPGAGSTKYYCPLLFSGDDFGTLCTREFADSSPSPSFPALTRETNDRARSHSAGVTAILPLFSIAGEGTVVLTGSYDEVVRVYLYRVAGGGRGEVLAEMGLGGGVWRLEVVRVEEVEEEDGLERRYLVLASCMHAGTRVLRVRCVMGGEEGVFGEWDLEVLAEFTEHESMNYASGVWEGEGEGKGKELLCVSSSFYDKRVCVWKVGV
ncbi:hypothetical protein FQN50_007084 [Emmonsiellopsis sp. PD_5]|nr:hypothetical protein FQN50_007084 [Emmonsiellopsis sp. PD_5]